MVLAGATCLHRKVCRVARRVSGCLPDNRIKLAGVGLSRAKPAHELCRRALSTSALRDSTNRLSGRFIAAGQVW
jgi:hypothetical protein